MCVQYIRRCTRSKAHALPRDCNVCIIIFNIRYYYYFYYYHYIMGTLDVLRLYYVVRRYVVIGRTGDCRFSEKTIPLEMYEEQSMRV